MSENNGIKKVLMEFTSTESIDWAAAIAGSGKNGDGKSNEGMAAKVAAGFYRLEALHKDHLYRLAEAHRDEVDKLKDELAREKAAREKRDWQDKANEDGLSKYQEGVTSSIEAIGRQSRLAVRVAVGISAFSIMMVGSFEGFRYSKETRNESEISQLQDRSLSLEKSAATQRVAMTELVDAKLSKTSAEIKQLEARINSFDEAQSSRAQMLSDLVDSKVEGLTSEIVQVIARVDGFDESSKAQNAQMKSFMVAQNDKTGATLKAIDVIKFNQSLLEWWSSDEGKNIFKDIHAWLQAEKNEKNE